MKVGFISHATVLNGAPITLAELVGELARLSDPDLFSFGVPVAGPLLDKYPLPGVELFLYGQTRFGREIPVGRPRIRGRLRKRISGRKISLVVANSLESFRAVEAASELGLPVIWLIHEMVDGYQSRREWAEIRGAAARADRLVFNSRIARSQAALLGAGVEGKSRVIYPGISLARPEEGGSPITGPTYPERGSPVLGAIGDICPQKGYADLIEAFALLAGRFPQVRLVIAGRVPEKFRDFKGGLDDRIRDLRLESRVRFTGEFFDLRRQLKEFDLFIHPSPSESFGRVVAEALAGEVPVVAVRSGGVEEIITDGETGLLVPAGAPEQLAEAAGRMLKDPEQARRTARAGRSEVEERFSLPRYAREIEDEIRLLTKRDNHGN